MLNLNITRDQIMTTRQELLQQLEAEIDRSKVIIRDLRKQKENLRQDILQSEIDNLEKYMAESEVRETLP